MAVEPRLQGSNSNSGDGTAFILAAIDRLAEDSRRNYERLTADIRATQEQSVAYTRNSHEQLAAEMRSSYDRLAADMRSNFESVRSDIRQLYYLNILTLLTALGALTAGLFALISG